MEGPSPHQHASTELTPQAEELSPAETINDRLQAASEAAGKEDFEKDFRLADVDCPSHQQWCAKLARVGATPHFDESDENTPRPRIRFSLFELMAVMTFAAVSLSAATWLPPALFAGVLGMLTLLGLFVLTLFPPRFRVASLAWVTTFAIYLAAAAVAVAKALGGA